MALNVSKWIRVFNLQNDKHFSDKRTNCYTFPKQITGLENPTIYSLEKYGENEIYKYNKPSKSSVGVKSCPLFLQFKS